MSMFLSTLVIEDNKTIFELIKRKFKNCTLNEMVNLIPAGSLKEAKIIAQIKTFDIIMLDLNLPDSRGLHTIKKVNTIFTIPIVIFSSMDYDMNLSLQCMKEGAQDVIPKDIFIPEEIYSRLCFAKLRYDQKKQFVPHLI